MVFPGSAEEKGSMYMATTSPKRSNRLHNFSLPFLKWGTQRHMRCTTTADGIVLGASGIGDRRSPHSNSDESTATPNPARVSKRKSSGVYGDDEEGIAVVREKLMLDLKTAADRLKDAILRNKEVEVQEEVREPETVRPWNLRTRREECKAAAAAVPVIAGEIKRDCSSPVRNNGGVKLTRFRRNNLEKTQRAKFSVALSKKEVEEDFMGMLGQRPPRRPNKRPKNVQKQLDTLFPGLWLTEVTADMYKVVDTNENGKARRCAKGKGKEKDESL